MNRMKIFGNAVLKLVLVCILGLVLQISVFAAVPKSRMTAEAKPGIALNSWEEDDEADGRR